MPAACSTCPCVQAAADLAARCMGTGLLPRAKDARAWGRGRIQDAIDGHVGVALGGVGACPVARAAREAARAVHRAAGVVAHRREARHLWRWRPRRSGPVPWLEPCGTSQLLMLAERLLFFSRLFSCPGGCHKSTRLVAPSALGSSGLLPGLDTACACGKRPLGHGKMAPYLGRALHWSWCHQPLCSRDPAGQQWC